MSVAHSSSGGRFGKPLVSQLAPAGLVLGGTLHFQPFERIDPATILLKPQGKSLRPGGDAKTPKPFSLHSQRQIRYKKVGVRRSYSLKQILSVRDALMNKKFPVGVDVIANVFEEGLGGLVGRIVEEEKTQESSSGKALGSLLSRGRKKKFKNSRKPAESKDNTSSEATSGTTSATESARPKKRAWVPPSLREKRGGMLDPLEAFERKIRSLLNKITLDTFDDLAPRVVDFFEDEVNDAAGLGKLVSLIFEKTVQEPLYGPLYAGVCVQLSQKEKKLNVTERQTDGTDIERQLGFKQALLKQCQREFENGKREVVVTSAMSAQDVDEGQIKQKLILIGTIQFIGQLYLHELLTIKIIKKCITTLLGQSGSSDEDIECVCELLRLIGQRLDESAPEIGVYFRRLQNIAKDKDGYPLRIRFMARNLLELRERGWTDDVQKKELRKKQEIRDEFEKQKGGRKRPSAATFDESDPTQIATVLDSDVDIGVKFGIKKFDVDVIGVDVSATQRQEPSLAINFVHRYQTSRQTQQIPEQRTQNRANRKERRRNFLLQSRDVSVSTVVHKTKTRRRPIEPPLDRPGTDATLEGGDKEEFVTKLTEFYTAYADLSSVGLGDTIEKIKKLGLIDRHLLAKHCFETVAQAMGESRERGARLLFALLDQCYISAVEFSQTMNEFFEFLVDLQLDCPNVFENVAYTLSRLFDDGMIQMDQLHVWLTKDESLKAWYKRVFDRDRDEMNRKSREESHGFTKLHKFVAAMITELGKLNEENAREELESIMTEQGFDLTLFVPPQQRSAFIREFTLQQYLG